MQPVEYIAKTIVTPRDAIASLVRWKITLLMATQMREPLSPRATHSVENPQECSIGLWLVSSHTLHLRGTPEYRAVLHLHIEFHREMQKIARLINAGDYPAAERLLHAPTGLQTVSIAVANAIMALERIPVAKAS
jgi:hypothetical protein